MRIGLALLWIMLLAAPLIAEKNSPSAIADNAELRAEQHADASTYGNKVGVHQGATGGKLR